MQLFLKALIIIIPLTAIMVTLFAWLRQDIKSLGERVEEQGKDIKILIADVAALKATVETLFRLRVDPPQPPDNPGAAQANKAA